MNTEQPLQIILATLIVAIGYGLFYAVVYQLSKYANNRKKRNQ